MNIKSPCVKNCCLNQDDVCLGCFRTLNDILMWGAASDAQKKVILELAIKRKTEHQTKYGC